MIAQGHHEAGIKAIVDIVPNHTAVSIDVLEALAAGRGSKGTRLLHLPRGRGENGELPPE